MQEKQKRSQMQASNDKTATKWKLEKVLLRFFLKREGQKHSTFD